MRTLINEDFNGFKCEELPYDKFHTALGEYHHFEYGDMGDYYDPIPLHRWRSMDGTWLIVEEDNVKYLEQNRGDNCGEDAFRNVYPTLVNKKTIYAPYTMSFSIRVFEFRHYCGMAFYYLTSRDYYFLALKPNKVSLLRRIDEDIEEIKSYPIYLDDLATYNFKLIFNENSVLVYIDNLMIMNENIDFRIGKVAFVAKSLCRYSKFKVVLDEQNYTKHLEKIKKEKISLDLKKSTIPPIRLLRKINLRDFGCGRELRVVQDKNKTYFIFMQNQKRYIRDSFARIGTMTCIDIEGRILWQIGEPNNSFDNSYISCDLPCQVYDINNDGKLELIYARDFYIYIRDFYTLNIIKKFPTPIVDNDPLFKDEPFHRLNVDMIQVADFEGLGYKGNLIIKDRYQNVIAYDTNFNELWRYHNKNTGHFPLVYDFNNDKKDEIFIGYDLVSSDGKILVDLPFNSDHTDEIIYASLKKGEDKKLILASGNEGFNIFNIDGTLFKHNEIGHAQRVSVAPFRGIENECEICITSFWGCNGIISLYDSSSKLIARREMMGNGSVITPINYDGVHTLILTYPDKSGGILDDKLDTVIELPEDGHPTVCMDAFDIDNDGIDEILVWNKEKMYIYKSSKILGTNNDYLRYPNEAMSNYRGEYLIPKIKKKIFED